jgi:RNA polymerase sigma factor (TIGR02999 family)
MGGSAGAQMDHEQVTSLHNDDPIEKAANISATDLNELIPLVYNELRAIAHRRLGNEMRQDSLQTTALVHEVYLKLAHDTKVAQRGRAYFFAAVSNAMRQVLVEHARRRLALKRGGEPEIVTLDDDHEDADVYAAELVDLEEALNRLGARSPRHAQVVELRYFAGLSVEQTAEVLAVSPRTVKSDWAMARAWLFRELGAQDQKDPQAATR